MSLLWQDTSQVYLNICVIFGLILIAWYGIHRLMGFIPLRITRIIRNRKGVTMPSIDELLFLHYKHDKTFCPECDPMGISKTPYGVTQLNKQVHPGRQVVISLQCSRCKAVWNEIYDLEDIIVTSPGSVGSLKRNKKPSQTA